MKWGRNFNCSGGTKFELVVLSAPLRNNESPSFFFLFFFYLIILITIVPKKGSYWLKICMEGIELKKEKVSIQLKRVPKTSFPKWDIDW